MSRGDFCPPGFRQGPDIEPAFDVAPLAAPAVGGAGRDRTGDLRLAKAALPQLSYSPVRVARLDGGPKWI